MLGFGRPNSTSPVAKLVSLMRVLHRPVLTAALVVAASSCTHVPRATVDPSGGAAPLSQLWTPARSAARDLLNGVGGAALRPREGVRMKFEREDATGASPGWDVTDASGRKWDVKLGPEARTEVVASRLLWAIGYHQPPMYFVTTWTLDGGPRPGPQPPGRFRTHIAGTKTEGEWSWHENPFIGSRPLQGLVVMMILINNWDLKTSQNKIYESTRGRRLVRHYVVQDLGASFGRTRTLIPGSKGEIEDFEREGFIERVDGGFVRFHYRGGWREAQVDDRITPDDVVWTCTLLSRLTERQWRDAFRAGGFGEAEAHRYITHMKAKVREGLALRRGGAAPALP